MPIIKSIIILLLYQIERKLSLIICVMLFIIINMILATKPVERTSHISHFHASQESLKIVIIQSN